MRKVLILLSIIVIGGILFIPFLGKVHLFDWDEINFAEIAREMIVTSNYLTVQIDFQPFWEKPPLFMWLQALSMHIFGINEFAARFPNAICGILTLIILFIIGKKLKNETFGIIWALTYIGSILPFLYFKSGIIDPWYNLLIFLSLLFIIEYFERQKISSSLLAGIFSGLALITKGPVVILLLFLTVIIYCLIKKTWNILFSKGLVFYILATILFGGSWFILQIAEGRFDIVQQFIQYQIRLLTTGDAGHSGPLYYHLIVLTVGVFPASIFAIRGFFSKQHINSNFFLWQIILLAIVVVIFSVVKTKIIHYSSLAYLPISYIAAEQILFMWQKKIKILPWQYIFISLIAFTYILIVSLIPWIDHFKNYFFENNLIKDVFAVEAFKANVKWIGYEKMGAILLLLGLILFYYFKNNAKYAITSLFISSMLFIYLTVLLIVPKIEKYTQGAPIEFFKNLQGKDVYVTTLNYFSYAHYFYTQKKPHHNQNAYDKNWLLTGNIDKPAYFVTKINHKEKYLNNYPELKLIYEKNGFVFFVREK